MGKVSTVAADYGFNIGYTFKFGPLIEDNKRVVVPLNCNSRSPLYNGPHPLKLLYGGISESLNVQIERIVENKAWKKKKIKLNS